MIDAFRSFVDPNVFVVETSQMEWAIVTYSATTRSSIMYHPKATGQWPATTSLKSNQTSKWRALRKVALGYVPDTWMILPVTHAVSLDVLIRSTLVPNGDHEWSSSQAWVRDVVYAMKQAGYSGPGGLRVIRLEEMREAMELMD